MLTKKCGKCLVEKTIDQSANIRGNKMSIKLPTSMCMFGINIKIWGWTQTIGLSNSTHIAHAMIYEGGYSSKHKHKDNWNRFYIVKGILQLEVFKEDGSIEILKLEQEKGVDIAPGILHRMTALTDVNLIEIYWTDNKDIKFDPCDIIREDTGGYIPHGDFKLNIPKTGNYYPPYGKEKVSIEINPIDATASSDVCPSVEHPNNIPFGYEYHHKGTIG